MSSARAAMNSARAHARRNRARGDHAHTPGDLPRTGEKMGAAFSAELRSPKGARALDIVGVACTRRFEDVFLKRTVQFNFRTSEQNSWKISFTRQFFPPALSCTPSAFTVAQGTKKNVGAAPSSVGPAGARRGFQCDVGTCHRELCDQRAGVPPPRRRSRASALPPARSRRKRAQSAAVHELRPVRHTRTRAPAAITHSFRVCLPMHAFTGPRRGWAGSANSFLDAPALSCCGRSLERRSIPADALIPKLYSLNPRPDLKKLVAQCTDATPLTHPRLPLCDRLRLK